MLDGSLILEIINASVILTLRLAQLRQVDNTGEEGDRLQTPLFSLGPSQNFLWLGQCLLGASIRYCALDFYGFNQISTEKRNDTTTASLVEALSSEEFYQPLRAVRVPCALELFWMCCG